MPGPLKPALNPLKTRSKPAQEGFELRHHIAQAVLMPCPSFVRCGAVALVPEGRHNG